MYRTTENAEKCTKTYGQISTRLQQLRFHNQNAGFNNHSRDGFKNHSFHNQQNGNRDAINPPPAPPHPWFLNSTLLVVEPLVVEDCGCWIRGFGCWIRLCWLLKPAFLVAEAMVAESGCFGCWIRLFWLLNPALLVAEALVVECFGCWFRLCWLLKLWLSNPSLWLLNPAFWLLNLSCWIRVGCWIRFCSSLESWCQHHELPKHRLAACKQLDLLLSPGRTWLFSCWLSSQAQCSG